MAKPLVLLALGCWVACAALAEGPDDWLLGHWPFDGTLADASGKGHDASGEGIGFVEGREGQAVKLNWQALEIADSPGLRLAPGLIIECWVYYDEKPTGYQPIVIKDKEYQLRLDDEREGGDFSFFVYLDGWEPRVSGTAPRAGEWYHLVATWTGTELSLEVNGQRSSTHRVGTPSPTDNPVFVGKANCRVENLRLANPRLLQLREMQAMMAAVPEGERTKATHFGAGDGWEGWSARWGAEMSLRENVISARFPDETALLVHPGLNVDAGDHTYVCVDIRSPSARLANLFFVTDVGHGVAALPVWDLERTCMVNLASHPSWRGKLRLLALGFPGQRPEEAVIGNLWLSDKPEGSPFLYVRNLAPTRAVLRAGREERFVAIVRNLGTEARNVRARLVVPEDVRVLGQAVQSLETVAYRATERFEWTVQAEKPVAGAVGVELSSDAGAGRGAILAAEFKPPTSLPRASYVPRPKPARSPYLMLMHYCPLWKAGTHYGWERIEDWPERRPAIGWYNEGTPEVADWHIKYALEHGIQGFIYCWYRANFGPDVQVNLGHALHDGLLKARYLDMFKFTIMWENGCANGVESVEDMMDNVLPYWMERYFAHPSYVKIDNKPLLFVWLPERVAPEVGGSEQVKRMFDLMREECRKRGFDGLYIVGCVGGADEGLLTRMAAEGWDASSAYGIASPSADEPGVDLEGFPVIDHRASMEGQTETLLAKKAVGALPDIVDIMMGWDPRPWHGGNTNLYRADPTPESFRAACERAKRIVDETPGNGLDRRIVVFDNWNEFGEGHYLEPCTGFGFGFLDALREVFCDEDEPCEDIVPEDVGLEPPESIYVQRRQILEIGVRKERKVVDHLLGAWSFDEEDEVLARDSSACGFDGFKDRFETAEGISGRGFLCGAGSVALQAHELLFPPTGITVELWMKTDVAGQADRWMLNTVGQANTGYRLGLTGGKIGWQIPQKPWSHMLNSPEPVPLGRWVHVVGTHDNTTMRLYVDGKLVGELERLGAVGPADGRLCIGAYGSGDTAHAFQGVLDEVRIYDRALTAEEVEARYREHAR